MFLLYDFKSDPAVPQCDPPPCTGRFIPINKWGPHDDRYAPDRYASNKDRKNGVSDDTTIQSHISTTQPYIPVPWKNTVIPIWFPNLQENKNTPPQKVENEGVSERTETDTSFTNDKTDNQIRKTLDVTTTQRIDIPSTLPTVDVTKSYFPSDTSFDISTEINIAEEKQSRISINDGEEINSPTTFRNLDLTTLVYQSSIPNLINTRSSKMETDLSDEEDMYVHHPTDITEYDNIDDSFVHMTTIMSIGMDDKNVYINHETIIEENANIDLSSEITSHRSSSKKTDSETSETIRNIEIESTTDIQGKVTPEVSDNDAFIHNYNEDTEDKSLEEIQNELIRLLDEMTKKYHNNSSLTL